MDRATSFPATISARRGATMESSEEQARDYAVLEDFLDLDNYKTPSVNVERLVDMLCGSILTPPTAATTTSAKNETEKLQALVGSADRLLRQLERADKELQLLQQGQARQLAEVQATTQENETMLRDQVGPLEEGLLTITSKFRQLHEHMNFVVRGAASFGDRLQMADKIQSGALEALQVVEYMQAFSMADTSTPLPDIFTNPTHLRKAAAMSRNLLQVGHELVGTIPYAVKQLENYRNQLENRVVSRFDAATAAGDLEAMAECTRIMCEFPRGEDIVTQRYIATRPMFMNAANVVFGVTPTTRINIKDALYELAALYDDVEHVVREELMVMEQVFPNPYRTLAQLVQRMFEQRVQMTLDRLLVMPNKQVKDDELALYLNFLVEAYRRTSTLCDVLETMLGGACNVMELADGVFANHLADYRQFELQWLEAKALSVSTVTKGVSSAVAQRLLNWNAEAVERSAALATDASKAQHVRMLFHASTAQQATSGCLLEQVASHVIAGLTHLTEYACHKLRAPYGIASLTDGQQLMAVVNKTGEQLASNSIGVLTDAIKETSAVVESVQDHYTQLIVPAIQEDAKEGAIAGAGLAAFTKAVEDRVIVALQRVLVTLFETVEKTLNTEQRKTDFLPPKAGTTSSIDAPTDACLLISTLIRHTLSHITAAMGGPNARGVNTEIGRRLLVLLKQHMQGFVYSTRGALRWRRDLMEYAEVLQGARVGGVEEQMKELQGISSMLIVAPDSLLGLVDSVLRISHAHALKFIRLREDFKTVKVDGKSLETVFAYD